MRTKSGEFWIPEIVDIVLCRKAPFNCIKHDIALDPYEARGRSHPPESVSAPTIRAARNFPNISQTLRGFPLRKRPKVIPAFYKNGHNYRKDYGLKLKAKTLDAEIIAWWGEIKASGLYFGGPVGTYGLIVLMTWWCSLLKDRPGDYYLRPLATSMAPSCPWSTYANTLSVNPLQERPPSRKLLNPVVPGEPPLEKERPESVCAQGDLTLCFR